MLRCYYVITGLLIIHVVSATIEWEIEYGLDHKPLALRCRGPQISGSWFKRWNKTDTTLSTFDAQAQVTVVDPRFTTTAYLKKAELQTQLSLPLGTFGTFGCKFGKEYHLFFLPKNITVYADSKKDHVTLKCQDSTYPQNISWYINSTLVAVAKYYNQSSYVIDDKNTSFTHLRNATFQDHQITTNNTRPLCVTCILHSNETYGLGSVCTPGTTDLSSGHKTRSDNFYRASRLEAVKPADSDTNVGNLVGNATGLGFVIGSVAFVCAVAGLVLLIHIMGRRQRPPLGYEQQVYRPLSSSSGGIVERNTS